LRRNAHIKLILVAGSIGKTSTKNALGVILGQKFRVRSSQGNQNTEWSVPFGVMGIVYPDARGAKNPLVLLGLAWRFFVKSLSHDDTEIIIQEAGTDKPGDMAHFGSYLHADITVLTAITPEHMEYFKRLGSVAREELAVTKYSDRLVINTHDTPEVYTKKLDFVPFGVEPKSVPQLIGEHSLIPVRGAVTVAKLLGMDDKEIQRGIAKIQPVGGRMQLLKGKNDTQLIDDTYNSSPEAVKAALEALYSMKAPQRIAVLGQMNELGSEAPRYHAEIGEALNPKKLDILITTGALANEHLAPAAAKKIKQVFTTKNAQEAGELVRQHAKKRAVVLFKGSQNGVYLEEAVKLMVKDPRDSKRLVRQTPDWLDKKSLG
jgi:UDP-N-acetylmuramoyl-tripeptide--D-alanyl-D-alanine ligase